MLFLAPSAKYNTDTIFIDNNMIPSLPTEIGGLTSLIELDLCEYIIFVVVNVFLMNNFGTNCDESLFLSESDYKPVCHFFNTIFKGKNIISSLPTEVGKMQSLEVLHLGK